MFEQHEFADQRALRWCRQPFSSAYHVSGAIRTLSVFHSTKMYQLMGWWMALKAFCGRNANFKWLLSIHYVFRAHNFAILNFERKPFCHLYLHLTQNWSGQCAKNHRNVLKCQPIRMIDLSSNIEIDFLSCFPNSHFFLSVRIDPNQPGLFYILSIDIW